MGVNGKSKKKARAWIADDVSVEDMHQVRRYLLIAYLLVILAGVAVIVARGELADWLVELP